MIGVVEDEAVEAPEDVFEVEAEFWVGFQAALEVGTQIGFALNVRAAEELGGDGRGEMDGFVIVAHDLVEVVGVPGGDPMVGEVAGFFFGHGFSR